MGRGRQSSLSYYEAGGANPMSRSAEELSRTYYREMVVQLLGIKDPKLLARLAR